MYNALLGLTRYDALARMDMRCSAELQSSDSEPSEHDVVPVPAELMAARLRIVEWQRHIHAALTRLEPHDHGDPPLCSAGNATVVDNVAMAADPAISTELRRIGPLADPADTLAPFRAVGPLDSEYRPLTCHHGERPIHCVMTRANRHIGRPFLMCPFAAA